MPVPASGLQRELVDAARAAIKDNRPPSPSGHRSWELSGLLRCSQCGHTMTGKTTSGGRSRGRLYFYYRCSSHFRNNNGCDHIKQHRAEKIEARVWEYVRGLLEDPEELRADLERMIELEREGGWEEPEREARMWQSKLTEVNRQRSRAQDMAIQGLLDYDELQTKLASLEETREAATYKLAILKDRREHIAQLERDREAVLEHYASIAPEALDALAPEERRQLYRTLRLKPVQYPDGMVEVELNGTTESSLVCRKTPAQVFAQAHKAPLYFTTHHHPILTRQNQPL